MKKWLLRIGLFAVFAALVIYIINDKYEDRLRAQQALPQRAQLHDTLVPPAQLKADFAMFRNLLTKFHPDPYRFISKEKLDAYLDGIGRKLDKPMHVIAFYRLLYPAVDLLGCSHSDLLMRDDILDSLKKEPIFYPGAFFYVGDTAVSGLGYCGSFPQGARLLSINRVPISQLTRSLEPYIITEGNEEVSQKRMLRNTLAFKYYWAFGDIGQEISSCSLDKDSLGPDTVYCRAQTFKDCAGISYGMQLFDYDFRRIDSLQAAVLSIHTFALNQPYQQAHFKRFLENSFDLIQYHHVKKLILDLRGNGGGQNDLRSTLLSYLCDTTTALCSEAWARTDTFPYKSCYAYQFGGESPQDLNAVMKKNYERRGDGRYYLRPDSIERYEPKKNRFRGELLVLADAETGSSAAELAAFLQCTRRGTLIGENCNGYYGGNSSFYMACCRLPGSGIVVQVPLVRNSILPAGYAGKSGVIRPDIPVPLTKSDFIHSTDAAMNKAIALLKAPSK